MTTELELNGSYISVHDGWNDGEVIVGAGNGCEDGHCYVTSRDDVDALLNFLSEELYKRFSDETV